MKRIYLLPLLFLTLLFTSCMDEDNSEPEYLELGVVYGNLLGNTIIKTDSDLKLLSLDDLSSYKFEANDRVLIRYSLHEKSTGGTYNYTINVIAIAEITPKAIVNVEKNPTAKDTLKYDDVNINSIWLAQDYLNIDFNYIGGITKHYSYVSYDPENQNVNNTIVLNLNHNANNDGGSTNYRNIICIPISELQDENATSVTLKLFSTDKSTSYDLTYTYGNE